MNDLKQAVREYWEKHPNAAAIGGGRSPQKREFYEVIEQHRYQAESCIREMAEFDRWSSKRVLEVGCGIGTDLRQFAAAGASVVGVDLTWQGVQMARISFKLFDLSGSFVVADAEMLPFIEGSFDLVYSNGVIHHAPDTAATVREIYRVARVGGQARIMVYHRNSYYARVIIGLIYAPILRILTWIYPKGALPGIFKRFLPVGLQEMYAVLVQKGFSRETVFSISTDPSHPGEGNSNPLARSYTRSEVEQLFSSFRLRLLFVRQLYYAGFLPSSLHRWVEHRFGWFLFIRAYK